MISQKEEMRTGTESSGVVLRDMIERIYFYFIIFSQKRNGKRETHVVLPGSMRSIVNIVTPCVQRKIMSFASLRSLKFGMICGGGY
jgi:hypothetical protein